MKKLVILSLLVVILLAGVISFAYYQARQNVPEYGATFSFIYAEQFNLDWQEVYLAMLDDLQLKKVRIPVYWSEVEKERDQHDFDGLDWMMNEAATREVDVTLVVGQKVPRWPECYIPDWAEYYSNQQRGERLIEFIKVTVDRYKDHPALERWQVENESYFPFGECPKVDPDLIAQEIRTVKAYDSNHPIQLTTSGEQAFWVFRALPADVLGVSLYRVVQDSFFGVWIFPYEPEYYTLQGLAASLFSDVIISELQVEPWGISDTRIGDRAGIQASYDLFTEEDVRFHMEYAEQTGIDEIYLWGIEWWYYLMANGEPSLWDAGKEVIAETYEE